jgi:hypothetical protein
MLETELVSEKVFGQAVMQLMAQDDCRGMRASDLWCKWNKLFYPRILNVQQNASIVLFVAWMNEFLFQKWIQGWQPCMVGCSTNWCVSIAKQAWTCTAVCYEKEWGSIARQEGGIILYIWWNVSVVMIHGFYGDTSPCAWCVLKISMYVDFWKLKVCDR